MSKCANGIEFDLRFRQRDSEMYVNTPIDSFAHRLID